MSQEADDIIIDHLTRRGWLVGALPLSQPTRREIELTHADTDITILDSIAMVDLVGSGCMHCLQRAADDIHHRAATAIGEPAVTPAMALGDRDASGI